jgi:hypothetical protein
MGGALRKSTVGGRRSAAADYLLLFGDPMMPGLTFLFIEG